MKGKEAEAQLRGSGISYSLTCIGYLPVNTSVSELSRETREQLAKSAVHSLVALQNGTAYQDDGQSSSSHVDTKHMTESPVLLDMKVIVNISAKDITVIHDDVLQKHNVGRIIQRHPIKNIAFFQHFTLDSSDDYFAYIVKKPNTTDRRCCVYSASKQLVNTVMDILQEATSLCTNDALNTLDLREEPNNIAKNENSSSGSVTPRGCTQDLVTPLAQANRISPRSGLPVCSNDVTSGSHSQKLRNRPWYHGTISCDEAERKLHKRGDFLIRESDNQLGQVILSILCEGGAKKHILLIDKDGKVRTKKMEFPDVAHLVEHYLETGEPVCSTADDLAVILLTPIPNIL